LKPEKLSYKVKESKPPKDLKVEETKPLSLVVKTRLLNLPKTLIAYFYIGKSRKPNHFGSLF
jgi:hypothetical protein